MVVCAMARNGERICFIVTAVSAWFAGFRRSERMTLAA